MSAKFQKSTAQSTKAKHKKEYYCSPCGNSYESDKKLYEHCSGLLHQVRRKENEKNYKPCCFMCKKTFPTLDAYGDHLNKHAHKEAERQFKRAISEGKTVQQLVKAKVINSPIPNTPILKAVNMQELQPPPDNTFCEQSNFGWNFNQSQPPHNNFYSYPQQGYPAGQYQNYGYYHPNNYTWYNNQDNGQFNRYHYTNDSHPFYQYPNTNNQGQPQNEHQPQTWRFSNWRNNQYFAQRKNAYLNNEEPNRIRNKHAGNEDDSQLLPPGVSPPVKRQHIYYSENEKAAGVSGQAKEDGDKTAVDGKNAKGVGKGNVESNKCKSPENDDSKICSIESDQSAGRKLSAQDYTFQLPESRKAANSSSDNRASPKSPTKPSTNANRKTPQMSNSSFVTKNDLQQSPKVLGALGSPRNQQQLNADNLRNLVNLSCSRKDKFLLDKLMCEYDQMTIKAAMNRMGKNLVTLVDKDAAKDVLASLSAFGLVDSGDSDDQGISKHIPEQLMGQIEELIQRSCQNVRPMVGFRGAAPFEDLNMTRSGDINTNMAATTKSLGVVDFPSHDFDWDAIDSASTGSAQKKKKKRKTKRPSKELPSEFEEIEQCSTNTRDHEVADAGKKLKTCKKKKLKTVIPPDVNTKGSSQDGDTPSKHNSLPDEEGNSTDLADQSCRKPSKASTPKKRTKSNKSASKNLTESSSKADVKSKKLKSSKTDIPPPKSRTKKTEKNTKNGKKKKLPPKQTTEDNASRQEPPAQEADMADPRNDSREELAAQQKDMADTSLEPGTTVAELSELPRDFPASAKCEVGDFVEVDLPDVIEDAHIKVEIEDDVIDLSTPDDVEPPPEVPALDPLEKASPAPSLDDSSSNVTMSALNFAIEEENIQCEIQHIERQLVLMKVEYERQLVERKAAFERELSDMKRSFEHEVQKAESSQEKLKERRVFVRQKCDSLMKSLLKSHDGRAIASSLKRIFSEIPNDFTTPEEENPLPNDNMHDGIPLQDLPQTESIQTRDNTDNNDTRDINFEEVNGTNGLTALPKRKRVNDCNNKSSKKAKLCSKKNKMLTDTENKQSVAAVKQEEPIEDVQNKVPKKIIKMEQREMDDHPTFPLSHMLPTCKDLDAVKKKQVSHFNGHVDDVVILKIHKCRLYSCSNDGTVRQFKTKVKDNSSEMKCIATYTHRSDRVVAMEIISQKDDQTFIITASQYGTLKKFDLTTGNCLTTLETKNEIVHINYRWSSLFVSCFDGNVSRHTLVNLKELDSFPCSSLPITCVATATEGAYRILCIGSGDGLVTLKEAHSGLFIRSYSLEEEYPFKIQVLKEDLYTLGCRSQQCRSIYIHKLLNGDLLQKIDILAGVLCMQVISQNLIIMGGKFGLIRLCDPKAKTIQFYYGGGGNKTVSSVCLNRNWLISGGQDGKIEACELNLGQTFVCNYGKCPGRFAYHEDIVYHISKIHAGSSLDKCLTNGCDYVFQKDPVDRLRHILTHVQLIKDKQSL